jgi:hypothetical protein
MTCPIGDATFSQGVEEFAVWGDLWFWVKKRGGEFRNVRQSVKNYKRAGET